jgi:eukaryotic-like serine/threonine-protein kinase
VTEQNAARREARGLGAQASGDTTLGKAFLQERVALYGLGGFLIAATFFVLRIAAALTVEPISLLHSSFVLHELCIASYLAVWLIARRGAYRLSTIRVLDYAGVFLNTTWNVLTVVGIPMANRPDYIIIQCLSLVLMPRAIFVPSSAKRTAAIGALMGVMLLVSLYYASSHAVPSALPNAQARELLPLATVVRAGIWWALTVGLAALTSHVIYGLQREVNRARRLGQYALEEKLGEGGMGVVYRASHAILRRPTAIKLLAPEKAGAVAIARFEQEVRLTARLTHPNTVTIYDYGRTPEGIFYYAMELLEGATLEQLVEVCGPQPSGRVVYIAAQVASALCEAHALGLIHRDIKPSNLMLCERGGLADTVKVVDFGLVKENTAGGSGLSHAGTIMGTPLYLAPEAIRCPEQVDARADLYALGAVLYYLLAGEHVFAGRTSVEICAHHLHSQPVPIAQKCRTDLGQDLADLVMECLAKDAAKRPQTAELVLERLSTCADARAWSARDARAWWRAHADELCNRDRSNPVSGRNTIAVDLLDR